MILCCPDCQARFVADDSLFPPRGRRVRCSNCGKAWFQPGPGAAPENAPAAAPEGPDESARAALAAEGARGFRAALAFVGAGALITAAAGGYLFGPILSERFPALKPAFEGYAGAIDRGRLAFGRLIGPSQDMSSFRMRDFSYSREQDPPEAGGGRFLAISAMIENVGAEALPAPRLKATLRAPGETAPQQEAFAPPVDGRASLAPGEKALYYVRLPAPQGENIEIIGRPAP